MLYSPRRSSEKILRMIKEKRSELIDVSVANGFVKESQELDYLIYALLILDRKRSRKKIIELRNMDGVR